MNYVHSSTNLLKNCPPQSWRGKEQISLQQFSTPPEVAYLLAKILNPSDNELILELSAGTGSLAAWLKVADCRFHLNELSATRRMLLKLQDYEPTGINAEFLDDLLPEEIAPDGVLMNPPFTASGGGTDFRPLIEAAAEYEPDALIYLTDLYGETGDEPNFPVIWATHGVAGKAPWGEQIKLK